MDSSIEKRGQLFLENQESTIKSFPFNSRRSCSISAGYFSEENKALDPEAIADCRMLIRKDANFFKGGRGIPILPMAAFMAVSGVPERKIAAIKTAYLSLRKEYFPSEGLALAAFLLSGLKQENEFDKTVQELKNVLAAFGERAPALSVENDYASFLFLAVSGLPADFCAEEAERCRSFLTNEFYDEEAVRIMSLVFALSGKSSVKKCQYVVDLYDALSVQRKKYSGGIELGMLAAVSLAEVSSDEILALQEMLGKRSKWWAVGRGEQKERLLWAALLLAQEQGKREQSLRQEVALPAVLLASRSALAQLLMDSIKKRSFAEKVY